MSSVRIDDRYDVAGLNASRMSSVRIDYRYVVAGLYGDRMGSVRIDDNSMLCICGQTHKTQKTLKYAFHNSSCDSYRFLRNLHEQIGRNEIKRYVSITAKIVPIVLSR